MWQTDEPEDADGWFWRWLGLLCGLQLQLGLFGLSHIENVGVMITRHSLSLCLNLQMNAALPYNFNFKKRIWTIRLFACFIKVSILCLVSPLCRSSEPLWNVTPTRSREGMPERNCNNKGLLTSGPRTYTLTIYHISLNNHYSSTYLFRLPVNYAVYLLLSLTLHLLLPLIK